MGRILLGLFLGFVAVFLGVYWVRTCLPNPYEEEIEWVERENAIVVQMQTSGGLPGSRYDQYAPALPDFTLYGDGTLILTSEGNESTAVLRTTLTRGEIRDLLNELESSGFFTFDYAQPVPRVTDAGTTFIYASSKTTANAVKAYALNEEFAEGDDFDQFRALARLTNKVRSIAESKRNQAQVLQASEGELEIVDLLGNPADGIPWPYPAVDVAGAAPSSTRGGGYIIENVNPADLEVTDTGVAKCWYEYQQADRLFTACYRPALPYEENFPVFDPPS